MTPAELVETLRTIVELAEDGTGTDERSNTILWAIHDRARDAHDRLRYFCPPDTAERKR